MKRRFVSLGVAMLVLGTSAMAWAAGDAPPPRGPQGAGQMGPGQMGPGQRGGGDMGPGQMGPGRPGPLMRDALTETLGALAQLNMSPDFDLTKEQKQKIQAIREDFQKQMEKWRSDKSDEFKKLQEQMAAARDADPAPPNGGDKFRQIAEARRKLMATAPKGDDAAAQVKTLLTDDQRKQLDGRLAEMDKQRQQLQERFRGGRPGGPGGGPEGGPEGGPDGGPGGAPDGGPGGPGGPAGGPGGPPPDGQ